MLDLFFIICYNYNVRKKERKKIKSWYFFLKLAYNNNVRDKKKNKKLLKKY
jgi:hypothetical protein